MRKLAVLALTGLLAAGLLSSCGDDDSSDPTPVDQLEVVRSALDEYMSPTTMVPVITAQTLFDNLNDGNTANDPYVLCVRTADDYAKGHVPGARNINWRLIADGTNLATLPTDRQIAVYCYTGHTGAVATTCLNALGYNAVVESAAETDPLSWPAYDLLVWVSGDNTATISIGALQIGPDNRMYIARRNYGYLSRINFPNTLGTGCTFEDQGVYLAGLELSVVTAVAVMFSALSTPVLSALYTLGFFVVGQWSYDLRLFAAKFPPELGVVLNVAAGLAPNLPLFNIRTLASAGETTTWLHLALATVYAAVYVACALSLASAAFESKDFK